MPFLPVTSPKVSAVLCLASGFIFGSAGYSNDATARVITYNNLDYREAYWVGDGSSSGSCPVVNFTTLCVGISASAT